MFIDEGERIKDQGEKDTQLIIVFFLGKFSTHLSLTTFLC